MNKKKWGALVILAFVLCMGMSMTTFAAKNTNGWVTKGTGTYYYKDGEMQKGWKRIDGKKYYFLKSGMRAEGRYKIGKTFYYFNSSGVYVKKLKDAKWVSDSKGRRFYNTKGKYLKNIWRIIQGKRYRFDRKGYALTGMKKVGKYTYYFDSKGAMVTKKWIRKKGASYYFGSDGKMTKNSWVGKRYVGDDGKRIKDYVDETKDSSSKTGWVGYGRLWKYYRNGNMQTGWRSINKKKYFFQSSGFMKVGWYNDGREYYFLNTTYDRAHIGVMCTGFMRIDGKVYYFYTKKVKDSAGNVHPVGSMARNIKIKYSTNNKYYTFDSKGVCQEIK